jgi:hypothetical protein
MPIPAMLNCDVELPTPGLVPQRAAAPPLHAAAGPRFSDWLVSGAVVGSLFVTIRSRLRNVRE